MRILGVFKDSSATLAHLLLMDERAGLYCVAGSPGCRRSRSLSVEWRRKTFEPHRTRHHRRRFRAHGACRHIRNVARGLDNELSLVDGQDRTLTIQQWDTFLNGVFPLDRNRLTREWFHSGSAVYNVAGAGCR